MKFWYKNGKHHRGNDKHIGWLICKVVYGKGGHQDNVFVEIDNLCDWAKTYHKDSKLLFCFIIDTDLTQKMTNCQNKYSDVKNILLYNTETFQEYFIKVYNTS